MLHKVAGAGVESSVCVEEGNDVKCSIYGVSVCVQGQRGGGEVEVEVEVKLSFSQSWPGVSTAFS